MAERQYQRLTGWRRRRFLTLTPSARSSLWLAPDHLLRIDSSYYTEQYKRFYFRDIQTITIRRTSRREMWNLIFGLLAIAGIALLQRNFSTIFDAGFVSYLVLMLLPIVGLTINNALGPTCAVHIRTAVQTEELPSLRRIPRTQRILDRIRPSIAAAQGALAEEEVALRVREMTATPASFSGTSPI